MVLISQKANGYTVTSTYKEGEEIIITTEEFDGCDSVETVAEIRYIDRDGCVYNPNGSKYKRTLKEYKELPDEEKGLSGGFYEIQIGECYDCDYCKKWGKSPEEQKEIIKAFNKQMEEDYGLY